MQLLLLLLLLFAAEGLVFPLPGTLRFSRSRGRARVRAATGPFLLPLRPGRLVLLATPPLFTVETDGVCTHAPLARLDPPLPARPRRAAFATLAATSVRGARVRIAGTPWLRALSRSHARALAARLSALATVAPGERERWLRACEDDDHDVAALRARAASARDALRWPGRVCDAYALLLFGGLPLAIAAVGEESALRLAAGPALALHVTALALGFGAHRTLLPAATGDRFETLLGAALFPPTMLRLPQRLFLAAVGVPPALAATAALLEEPERSERLAQALAAADVARGDDPPLAPARVLAVAAAAGVSAERLRRPRERRDAVAAAYCPVCLDDHLAGFEVCASCRAPLVAYRA